MRPGASPGAGCSAQHHFGLVTSSLSPKGSSERTMEVEARTLGSSRLIRDRERERERERERDLDFTISYVSHNAILRKARRGSSVELRLLVWHIFFMVSPSIQIFRGRGRSDHRDKEPRRRRQVLYDDNPPSGEIVGGAIAPTPRIIKPKHTMVSFNKSAQENGSRPSGGSTSKG